MSGAGDRGTRPRGSRERPRRPARVFSVGTEPDVRFTLANERTALAWVRTALAFVVTGLAAAVADDVVASGAAGGAGPGHLLRLVSVLAVTVAAWLALGAAVRWARTERALRLGQPLPPPSSLALVVLAVLALAVVAVVSVL